MNYKLFALMILSAVLLVSPVSANTTVVSPVTAMILPSNMSLVNVAGNLSSINPGESITLTFQIKNSHTVQNFTNGKIAINLPTIFNLKSASIGSVALANNTDSIELPVNISKDATSSLVTLVFQTNKDAAAGTYSGTVTLSGSSTNSRNSVEPISGTITPINLVYTIKTPTLSIAKLVELTKTQNGTINVTNTGNDYARGIIASNTSNSGFSVNFVPSAKFTLAPGESKILEVVSNVDLSNVRYGSNTVNIKVSTTEGISAEASTSFTIKTPYCRSGLIKTNLSLDEVDINNIGGDDDNVWKPLDHIRIEVDVKNLGTVNSLSSVYVELGFFDSNKVDQSKKLFGDNNKDKRKVKLGTVQEDDEKTAVFDFVLPAELKDETYTLVIKTYSKNEESGCTDTSESTDSKYSISIDKEEDEDKLIAFQDISLSNQELVCGDKVTLNYEVFNVGKEEQDQVKVRVFNKDLGIDMFNEMKEGIDEGESKIGSFELSIPEDVKDGTYPIRLSAQYEYDEDDDVYEEITSKDYYINAKIIGCSNVGSQTKVASILVTSETAKAGEKFEATAKITNTGSASADFVIGVNDYQTWGNVDSIEPRIVTLSSGESKEVKMIFSTNKDAAGENSFVVEVLSNGNKETKKQSFSIEGKSTGFSLSNNSLIWVIGAVNLVLIILIIVVAIRLSKR